MGSSQKKITDKTREKQLGALIAALQCFKEHGFEATTIEMIRDASGMSVGSLYHHFGNKEKIASALFREGMRSYARVVKQYATALMASDAQPELEQGVKMLVYANVDWISENPDWARFVFHHRFAVTQSGDEDAFRGDISDFRKMLATWAGFMGVSGFDSLDINFVSSLITGPTHGYARQWLAGRVKTPLVEHREAFADAAWAAVQGVLIKGSSTS